MRITWKLCVQITAIIMGVYLLIRVLPMACIWGGLLLHALLPLLAGCAMAYVVNILLVSYERGFVRVCKNAAIRQQKRAVCLFLAFLSIILVLVVLWQLIVPQLFACFTMVYEKFPQVLETLYGWMEERFEIQSDMTDYINGWMQDSFRWEKLIEKLPIAIKSMKELFRTLGTLVVSMILAVVFSIYLLVSKERLGANVKRLAGDVFPPGVCRVAGYVLRVLDESFHRFIVGQCVEAVILGGLCALGMWIFRFPYALMIGCLVGVTALLPVAGAYIGAGIGAFMILTVSPFKAVLFLVFITVLQQVEGNFIYPRVVGKTIGLPGIWVLSAVVVGGGAFGIVGMLLGVPLAAAAYRMMKDWMAAKEDESKSYLEK